ncbi:hypothetical protein GCM10019059_39570 [Camelimonas fluminis]|nr:hypothetical protein GCM10019059_39570 [Camelimonas fluminis]
MFAVMLMSVSAVAGLCVLAYTLAVYEPRNPQTRNRGCDALGDHARRLRLHQAAADQL